MFSESGQPLLCVVCRGGGKGGGGGGTTQWPEPIILTDPVTGKSFVQQQGIMGIGQGGPSAQDQLNSSIDQRLAQEQAAKAAEQARIDQQRAEAAAEEASQRTNFQTRLGGARDLARTNINNYFNQQGVDPNLYGSDITAAIDTATATVPDLDPAPASAFANLGEQILSGITSGGRTRASDQVANYFPTNYAEDRLTYGAMDPVVSEILGEQFNPLNTSLTYARDRGTLSGSGYSAALDALEQKRKAAESTIRGLGQSIVDTDRNTINDIISGARTTASGLSPSQLSTFDPASFRRQADERIAREQGSFGGELRSAVGSTKFADLTELLNVGGSAQGARQPSITNPVGIGGGGITDELRRRSNTPRGLGNAGAF